MSIKELDVQHPEKLSDEELQYAFDRYLIDEETFLEHSGSKVAKRRRAQLEMAEAEAAEATPEDDDNYQTWSVDRLKSEIRLRNADREPEERLARGGNKSDLIETLENDDAEQAGA